MRLGLITFALAACVAGASCGGADSATGVSTQTNNNNTSSHGVTVSNDQFSPSTITVPAGSTVTFTWNACTSDYYGNTCVDHEVGFDDGVTSPLQSSGTFDRTFATAGTYPYHCLVHGVSMSGTVIVQ